VPCYDLAPVTEPTLVPPRGIFRYSRLPWLDRRWVQSSRTYSPRYGWPAITSDSNFMRSSFRPQSELGDCLMRLAPPYGLATHCQSHCNMSVAQGIKGPCWFDVIPTFLPALRTRTEIKIPVLSARRFPMTLVT